MESIAIKKPTHIQSRRDAAERSMRRVIYLLRWNEEDYAWMKYKYGLRYLEVYLKGDKEAADIISRSKIFWDWWKNHWTLREESYLMNAEHLDVLSIRTRHRMYVQLHHPEVLAEEIRPHARILGDSYEKMIREIFKTSSEI